MSVEVRPLSGSLGAEVAGVDLSRDLDDDAFAALRRAFLDHQVLVFRDQRLTPERQLDLVRRFGPPMIDPFIRGPADHPALMEVVREPHEERAFGESWHSDNTYLERPPLASFLYAKEVPPFGGDTRFASQYLAYETLSPGLRAFLDDLRAVHAPRSYAETIARGNFVDSGMKLRPASELAATLASEVVHPVARTHPDTGRRALYVNAAYTIRFDGWTEAESRPLLDYLFAHSTRGEFTARLRWQAGSLTMWDNRCVLHQAISDTRGHRRVMVRASAQGERPV